MQIDRILAQPFHHIARGCRVHAFRSANGKYVLKTLTTTAEIIDWFAGDGVRLNDLPWAANLGPDDASRCDAIQRLGLESATIAWRDLRDDTALIHLETEASGTDWPAVDLGDDWPPFRPGTAPFMLQHYADLTGPLIKRRMAQGDVSAARRVIDDVVGLVLTLARHGIASETLNFLNNWGYVGHRLAQIDIGEFTASRGRVLEQAASKQILRSKSARRLRRDYPQLANYLAEQVNTRLQPSAIEKLWRESD